MCVKGTVAIVWRENLREGRLEVEPLGHSYRASEGHTREGQWDEAWEMPVGFGR